MTIIQKIKLIQQISGLTQAQLANRLGVTFAALNRWVNGKATPRQSAQQRIDELYREYTGQKQIPEDILEAKKAVIIKRAKNHRYVLGEILGNPDIQNQFLLSLTYNSNRIEGSSLSENETAAILFHNAALPNKSLTEQLEAKNHQAALEYLFQYLTKRKPPNEELILRLHSILMNGIRSDAGQYRVHAVRIVGGYVPTANFIKISKLMNALVVDIQKKNKDVIQTVSAIHSRFEQIHPFADGNGRVGRLLMHAMLLRANSPPAVIRQENKRFYLAYLNKAQLQMDFSLLEDFICDAVMEGYNILERK
ncbi:hypothetical protein A3H10_04795 [Candidatus Uhrbacteria bacterium RIFCSPLOWO2_12_FULL_46_10]|uniref:Fido domain-containing protein n=1 Tax=Candidatus Uhrbacteria bacterium RIFCSPLOWO2_01_FULL_47_25 TaxID=1802402 RepID=A0A1F7UXT1_9BACT|nr:MAG: hypothetical protein A2752_00900 [Candidatus Uhrbacteria bacterium RIFCSPHIGHO2_01_FULL_46_23]OGL69870.1 MAG: hypothetical protein A3D60_00790 [Candidatus Uhrbacteria bacterium RIFCSPHIGHO2_02_FULL_47_29]OGL75649.1 MAG: hypothetical protein A3E96_01265 [Candidatus Uhrbacteria bacterium RIFCSPHIGHO2_12_FULL_46_13]OGL82467.1 MAG: hypothetical protein A2936_02060 [Candidatus Uhrbacteria bacterium RIFCSPLOWO2_01_FULL_47_25]OGL85245.1 MAG: hypothetical protein A3I37_02860 [Candidatus Uhrbact